MPISRSAMASFLTAASAVMVVIAQVIDPGSPVEAASLTVPVAAFALWAWWPRFPPEAFALGVAVPVALVVAHRGHLELAIFLPVLMVLAVGRDVTDGVRAGLILVFATAAVPFVVLTVPAPYEIGWAPWMAAHVFTFLLGRELRRQQHTIDDLNAARQALADEAVAEERRRIARELHDLAGHTLAAMLLHVTGARHVLRRDIDEAERALADSEAVGRRSLDQIRATVTALRSDEKGTDASLAEPADVIPLVEEYRRAGLVIDLEIDGALDAVSGRVGSGMHRIVREALANVARHAPHNRTRVHIDVAAAGGSVRIEVDDVGRRADPSDHGQHTFGVIGMAERARSLGGHCSAGPTEHGWRVSALLRDQVAQSTVSPS
ncbi:histidine kinase [soil metagenome]